MSWVPLGFKPESVEGLHEGVPEWLRLPISRWAARQLVAHTPSGYPTLRTDLIQKFDMRTRNPFPYLRSMSLGTLELDFGAMEAEDLLRWVDFLIAELSRNSRSQVQMLEEMLVDSGSLWRVGNRNGIPGLERRVDETALLAAEEIMAEPTAAASLLADAWKNTYGIEPNPTVAYSQAVKAVEAAILHVVLPKDKQATLGKLVTYLRGTNSWTLLLEGRDGQVTDGLMYRLASTIWKGQKDRHGSREMEAPSQLEAEMAVVIAIAMIQLLKIELKARS